MSIAGGLVLPTDTIHSFCDFSRMAASSFWWLWSAQSCQDEGRGEHFSAVYFIDFIQTARNIKRDKD